MDNREFFIKCWNNEIAAFGKVIRALPNEKLDYTHHERSAQAGNLAWQLATEAKSLLEIAETGQTDYVPSPHPGSNEQIAADFDKAAAEVPKRVGAMDDAKWNAPAKFLFGGQVAWEAPTSELFWGFLFDMIHHRGQLSTYIRPMGGKVPSIYGPSGDETGG
jgi:uncharacterized damage-inducible protein DinB